MAYELGVDIDNGQMVAALHQKGDVEVFVSRATSGEPVDELRALRNSVSEAQGTPPRSTVVLHPTSLDAEGLDTLRTAVSQLGLNRVGLLPRAVALAHGPTNRPDIEAGCSLAIIDFDKTTATLARVNRQGARWRVADVVTSTELGAKRLVARIHELDPDTAAVLVAGSVPSSMAAALARRLDVPVATAGPTDAAAGAALVATDRWAASPVRPAVVPAMTEAPVTHPEAAAVGADLEVVGPEPEEPTRRRGALLMVAAAMMLFGGIGALFAANLLGSDDPLQLDTRRLDLTGGEVPRDPEPARFDVGLDDGKPVVLGVVEARKPTTSTTTAPPAPAPRAPRRAPAAAAPTTAAAPVATTTIATTTLPPTTAATTTQPTTTLPPTTRPPTTTTTTAPAVDAGDPDFAWSPRRPRELETATFSDRSDPTPISVTWSFPDGSTAQGAQATHVFTDNGRQRVSMTACWDHNGDVCRTRTRTVDVRNAARGDAEFTWSPNQPTAGSPVSFINQSTRDPVAASWDFGDGTSSTQLDPTKVYAEKGEFEVQVRFCWDLNGDRCRSRTHKVTVAGEVVPVADRVASVSANPTTTFPGFPIELNDASTPSPASVTWTFPDGQQVSGPRVQASFVNPGERVITAEICWTAPDECQTASLTITITDILGN